MDASRRQRTESEERKALRVRTARRAWRRMKRAAKGSRLIPSPAKVVEQMKALMVVSPAWRRSHFTFTAAGTHGGYRRWYCGGVWVCCRARTKKPQVQDTDLAWTARALKMTSKIIRVSNEPLQDSARSTWKPYLPGRIAERISAVKPAI